MGEVYNLRLELSSEEGCTSHRSGVVMIADSSMIGAGFTTPAWAQFYTFAIGAIAAVVGIRRDLAAARKDERDAARSATNEGSQVLIATNEEVAKYSARRRGAY